MRHGGGGGGGGGAGDRGAVHPADGRAVLQHIRHQVSIINKLVLLQSYHATLFQIQGRCAGEVRGCVREEVPHRAENQDLRPHAQNVQEAARQEV